MQPVPTDRKGEIPAGKGPTYLMPIVHVHKGLLTVNYGEQTACSCNHFLGCRSVGCTQETGSRHGKVLTGFQTRPCLACKHWVTCQLQSPFSHPSDSLNSRKGDRPRRPALQVVSSSRAPNRVSQMSPA